MLSLKPAAKIPQHRRAHAHNTTIDGRAAAHDAANEIWSALGLGCVKTRSWLCKNAKTLNRDRRSYSSKTALVAQRASEFNLEIELKNIILRRVSIF